MRPSPFRHPLAVLRSALKFGQKEMAEVCECSVSAIQSVELGRLKLSEELAYRISLETGVSIAYLLNGDPHAPIINREGEPYSIEAFHEAQAAKRASSDKDEQEKLCLDLAINLMEIFTIYSEASRQRKYALCEYKVKSALQAIAGDLGVKLTWNAEALKDLLHESGRAFSEGARDILVNLPEIAQLSPEEFAEFDEWDKHQHPPEKAPRKPAR